MRANSIFKFVSLAEFLRTATLDEGVEIHRFDERLASLQLVSKVAIRQLCIPQRTPEMIDGVYRSVPFILFYFFIFGPFLFLFSQTDL